MSLSASRFLMTWQLAPLLPNNLPKSTIVLQDGEDHMRTTYLRTLGKISLWPVVAVVVHR